MVCLNSWTHSTVDVTVGTLHGGALVSEVHHRDCPWGEKTSSVFAPSASFWGWSAWQSPPLPSSFQLAAMLMSHYLSRALIPPNMRQMCYFLKFPVYELVWLQKSNQQTWVLQRGFIPFPISAVLSIYQGWFIAVTQSHIDCVPYTSTNLHKTKQYSIILHYTDVTGTT